MKKTILLAAALLVSFGASAEYKPCKTNNFGSNWYIGAEGGVNLYLDGLYSSQLDANTALVGGLSVGKWLAPEFAVQFNGYYGGMQFDGNTSKYLGLGIQTIWDVTASVSGYNPDRVFAVNLALNGEYAIGYKRGSGVGAGVKFPIRLAPRFYFVPEIAGTVYNDAVFSEMDGVCCAVKGLVGIQYQFSKTHTFTTIKEVEQPYMVAVAEAEAAKAEAQSREEAVRAEKQKAQEAGEALAAENQALKNELNTTAAANEAIVKGLMSAPSCVYFEIGCARLSVKEMAHFDYLVKYVVAQGKNLTFTVSGYTDKNTGSVRRNKQLAKQRADYIKKLLVTKYGLTSDQFKVQYKPNTNIFTTIELNRAVIISAE